MVDFRSLLIGIVALFLPLYCLVITLISGNWRFFDDEED